MGAGWPGYLSSVKQLEDLRDLGSAFPNVRDLRLLTSSSSNAHHNSDLNIAACDSHNRTNAAAKLYYNHNKRASNNYCYAATVSDFERNLDPQLHHYVKTSSCHGCANLNTPSCHSNIELYHDFYTFSSNNSQHCNSTRQVGTPCSTLHPSSKTLTLW